MQNLINYIEKYVKLSDEAVTTLEKLAVKESYPKNSFILEKGQYCDKMWFLSSGMVRKYFQSEKKEMTIWIHTENEIFTSLTSYSSEQPTEEYLQVCEDCELISITKINSQILNKHPEFVTFSNKLMEQAFVSIDKHNKEFTQRDAKGKYEYLTEIAPEIIKRAKLGHIASLIGVTQETLSRIRGS